MLTRQACAHSNAAIPRALFTHASQNAANREPPSNTTSNTLTLTLALWIGDVMIVRGERWRHRRLGRGPI
jgi:hypothetical protein